jgi:hypothetical protein
MQPRARWLRLTFSSHLQNCDLGTKTVACRIGPVDNNFMTFAQVRHWFGGRATEHVAGAIEEISRDEVVRVIDEQARRRRGMSAEQLLRAFRAGRLDQPGDVADLLVYSDLLSPKDPIFLEPAQEVRRQPARVG